MCVRNSVIAASLAVTLALAPRMVRAAEITYMRGVENVGVIWIVGSIEIGDALQFERAIAAMPEKRAIMLLEGPGGRLREGLIIGETIRARGYATFVRNQCASVCGLIWLAGTNRVVDESSSIGFHAAYTGSELNPRESGLANALVGAYLTRLGYSYSVVAFATSAAPEGMAWLKSGDAQRLGLEVEFASNKPSAASAAAPSQAPVPRIQLPASPSDTARAAAATTPAYAEGRRDRTDYEQWFAGLPAGKYLDGATFWAANRSRKPQPACTNPGSPAWQFGCNDGRARLAPVDVRRKTEPNYWWGWNSL